MTQTQTASENQELNKIEERNLAIVEKAQNYVIQTPDHYTAAMTYAAEIKAWRKGIDETFDPGIEKAHQAHKAAVALKKKFLEPIEKALSFLDQKGRAFRMEQDYKRREEERIAKEAQEKELERLRKLEENAKARNDEKKAEEFRNRAEVAAVSVPVVKAEIPKVDGIKVRKIWKFEIIDESKLERIYLKPDTEKIGSVVRATKGTLPIAGIRMWSEDSKI